MSKEYIKDELTGLEYVPLEPKDTFAFTCKQCGNCCRNVQSAVPIETLDIFRMAKHFQRPLEEVIEEYTDVELLLPNFPMLFLKAKPEQGACIFLKAGRCAIQKAKPRTCRMYPLSAGPDENGRLEYLWVAKKHHLYAPGDISVGGWMDENLSAEDRKFLLLEYGFIRDMRTTLRILPDTYNEHVLKIMLIYRYFAYDLRDEFLEQYKRNMSALVRELDGLARIGAN